MKNKPEVIEKTGSVPRRKMRKKVTALSATAKRSAVSQSKYAEVVSVWNVGIDSEEAAAWCRYAGSLTLRDLAGNSRRLTGGELFVMVNMRRLVAGAAITKRVVNI